MAKKAKMNPFASMMKMEKKESKKEEKSEKYNGSKASKMDMKMDKMLMKSSGGKKKAKKK